MRQALNLQVQNLFSKAVANGRAITLGMERREITVVVDQVEVGFGTDKNVFGHIKANTAAEVSDELIVAAVGGATRKVVARIVIVVETHALHADACEYFAINAVGKMRDVDAVEVPVERAEGLIALVHVLGRSPVDLRLKAKALVQQVIEAEAGEGPAADGLGRIAGGVQGAGTRRGSQGADAEGGVNLLGVNSRRCHK